MDMIFAFLRTTFAAIVVTIALGGSAMADDAPLKIIVHPGQSDADVEQILDFAARSGRPVAIEVGQATTVSPGTAIPIPAAVAGNTGTTPATFSQVTSTQAVSQAPASSPPAALAPAAAAPAPAPAPMTPTPEMMATDMGMAKWSQFSAAFMRGATTALSGVGSLPTAMVMADEKLTEEGSSHGRVLLLALSTIAAAATATLILRRLIAAAFTREVPQGGRMTGIIGQSLRRMIGDLASVAFFLVATRFVFDLLGPQGEATTRMVRSIVTAIIVASLYVSLARLLFKKNHGGRSLVPINRPEWHFRILVTYGLISAAIAEMARLAGAIGIDSLIIDGWFLTGNTLLTLLKLYWFIGGRNDIRDAFISDNPGIVRRVAGNLLPEFYVVTALALWLICVLFAGTPNSARWIFAAGTTQMALLALPILALGAHALVDDFTRHHERVRGAGLGSSLLASLRVLCAGAVWIGGLHLITAIWSPFMGGQAADATGWILWLERLSFAIVASWAVASFIWHYSEALAPSPAIMLPGHEDQNEKRQTSRLSTAMPVVRNLALGAVLAVGALVILSALGVNVAPLLAGFGVLGLALSFGSQALVKDIVSGIFFIAEDAFRIGEYISTGSQQGTVEQIAIRSVRLRHHNGPIHTVPFGQISSVSNYSRDWGTIKFQLKFERESDPELIRKTAKKVGIAMLDDPEFGADFLVPLKMQGIQDITETSIVVRFKFTSLPGNPSIIKREAIKRLISACKAAGLEFASNAVTVKSRGEMHDDAAAATMLQPLAPVASSA
ncbi:MULTISPECIES: mechanosensitive ion channel family protein [Rhizobiaceae]|uniref:Small-conductance mechanosensitive channel n=1 Tax=Aliirhizobium cellulosilyticum TaxID=393664 RepID=A0A7W6S6G7_9HYPH|nr:mechanosensitive ion channel family protein [Rhizobium cellulosilyticum]MBB4348116.1 small-conductance mechanosensitive channel [Rhizobium cellulosilyticum]MBB4411353.1 small-conductance mechanosensitive channel [Rhizobium cellulosilyticum]MBB4446042.1 small-conductance mechanosensitive channel [Rhizobium cellulosilyticum]